MEGVGLRFPRGAGEQTEELQFHPGLLGGLSGKTLGVTQLPGLQWRFDNTNGSMGSWGEAAEALLHSSGQSLPEAVEEHGSLGRARLQEMTLVGRGPGFMSSRGGMLEAAQAKD